MLILLITRSLESVETGLSHLKSQLPSCCLRTVLFSLTACNNLLFLSVVRGFLARKRFQRLLHRRQKSATKIQAGKFWNLCECPHFGSVTGKCRSVCPSEFSGENLFRGRNGLTISSWHWRRMSRTDPSVRNT